MKTFLNGACDKLSGMAMLQVILPCASAFAVIRCSLQSSELICPGSGLRPLPRTTGSAKETSKLSCS